MTPEGIGECHQALDAAGVGYTCESHADTVHGFTMSGTDAFNPPHGSATGIACCPSSTAP